MRRVPAVVAGLAAIALGVAVWFARDEDRVAVGVGAGAAASPARDSSTVPARAHDDDMRRPSARRGSVPMPPMGTVPADVIAALLPAADAGDMRAACRVAIELLSCHHTSVLMTPDVAARRGTVTRASDPAQAEQDRFEASIVEHDAACRAIPSDVHARMPALLRAAARAGEHDAALLYAQGIHMMRGGTHDFLADPGFDAWRAEAEGVAWRAFRAGDRSAVLLLAMAASSDFGPFEGLVDDDPLTWRALWLLNARIGAHRAAFRPLPPDDERRAAALAADWHARHFGGRVDGSEFDMGSLGPWMPWAEGRDRERERCPDARVR